MRARLAIVRANRLLRELLRGFFGVDGWIGCELSLRFAPELLLPPFGLARQFPERVRASPDVVFSRFCHLVLSSGSLFSIPLSRVSFQARSLALLDFRSRRSPAGLSPTF